MDIDKRMSLNLKNPELNHLIASVFHLNLSTYCSKPYTVCLETKLQKNSGGISTKQKYIVGDQPESNTTR